MLRLRRGAGAWPPSPVAIFVVVIREVAPDPFSVFGWDWAGPAHEDTGDDDRGPNQEAADQLRYRDAVELLLIEAGVGKDKAEHRVHDDVAAEDPSRHLHA